MIAEAIESIQELAKAADARRVVTVPAEPPHVYWLDEDGDGTLKRCEAAPEPRNHVARDLSAVVDFARRTAAAAEDPDGDGAYHGPAVWYSRERVVCLIGDGTRRDRVTLPLDLSPQLKQLLAWEKAADPLLQAKAVLTLRTLFDGCLGTNNLVAVLRNVKFRTTADGSGTVEHGRRSIGQSIEATITGADAIPEYVVFEVPLFAAALPHRDSVRCALEPNAGTATVTFHPLPGQAEQALAAAERAVGAELAAALAEAKVPVYYGRPD